MKTHPRAKLGPAGRRSGGYDVKPLLVAVAEDHSQSVAGDLRELHAFCPPAVDIVEQASYADAQCADDRPG